MRRVFVAYVLGVLVLYVVSAVKGWELGAPRRGVIPQSVRTSPGGYRSFNYWRGGK